MPTRDICPVCQGLGYIIEETNGEEIYCENCNGVGSFSQPE